MAKGNTISIDDLFTKGEELAEERANTLEAQAANRDTLRNLDKMGLLSEQESARLEEMYPIRTRTRAEQGIEEG